MRRARPAAAPGRVGAKAAAKAKAVGARPKARLRRPARAEDPGAEPVAPESVGDKYSKGEAIRASDLPLASFLPGQWIATVQASYFGEECLVAGRIRRVQLEGDSAELIITPSGTQSEALLRYATGIGNPEVRLHLCPRDCPGLRTSPDLVHVQVLKKLEEGKDYSWEINLAEGDHNSRLREEQEQWRANQDKGPGRKEDAEVKSSSSSRRKKKKKKKKKEKDSRKEKVKVGGKTIGQKPLASLYQGTGLDPDMANRKRLLRKVRKQLRRNRSESSSSSSSSASADDEEFKQQILVDKNKVHRVASYAPGVLSASSVGTMKEFLLQSTGTAWQIDDASLPPIMSQYVRSFLAQKASGGILREMTTVAHTADLLLQGRVAEAVDTLAQRLKSLEMSVSGQSWSTGQRIELAPGLEASISSRTELQLAQKENQAEMKARTPQSTWEKGKSKGKGKEKGKSKEGGREKGKGQEAKKRWEPEGREVPGELEEEERKGLPKPEGESSFARCLNSNVTAPGRKTGKTQWKRLQDSAEITLADSDEEPGGAATHPGSLAMRDLSRPMAGEGHGVPENTSELAAAVGEEPQFLEHSFHPTVEGVASPGWVFSSLAQSKGDKPDSQSDSGLGRVDGGEKEGAAEVTQLSFSDVLCWLESRIESLLGRLCKVKSSGRIFPLPTALLLLNQCMPDEDDEMLKMIRVVCCSLNFFNGEGVFSNTPPTSTQLRILKEIREDCVRVKSWDHKVPVVPWTDFFRVRGVDYKGEEILTARPMQWENVEPALPQEVGAIPLESVCDLGCRHFVENFPDYVISDESVRPVKPAKVMVAPEHWETFCTELLSRGIFARIHEDDVHKVDGCPILNGLFGVSKQEFSGDYEVMRIIMNLVPANTVIRSIDGDIATLPGWSGMTPLELMPDEDLVVSSEDVRCFFYIFKIPLSWHSVMAFNRPLPPSLAGDRPGKWYPCSAVLPMGFKNSVAIAQAVHRFVAKEAIRKTGFGAAHELRKDRSFSTANPLYRIYLDNFDSLQRVSKKVAEAIQGKASPLMLGLREEYTSLGIPRHPKKSVANSLRAEVQGAVLDGQAGVAYPKPEKLLKYAHLTWMLLQSPQATQKQVQVVGGGLVYFCMFRRPLLGALNSIWQFITAFEGYPPFIKLPIPSEVKEELARFLGLIPLAFMDFRLEVSGKVLTIGLFDGIGALRVACDVLGWNVQGHVSVELQAEAHRVVEAHFPQLIKVSDVELVDEEMVRAWSQRFSSVALVVIGAGPCCEGVSGLNASRRAALQDKCSCLFVHVKRIRELVIKWMPWAQVRSLMESVASMDQQDEQTMSDSFGCSPLSIDAGDISLAHRPRLYWVDWEVLAGAGVEFEAGGKGPVKVHLQAEVRDQDFLQPGWTRVSSNRLPTFTTSRPRSSPGYKPAGLHQCQDHERLRWQEDAFRFPPYQYRDSNCLTNRDGSLRVASINEREVIMGFPKDYTIACVPKQQQGTSAHLDMRLTLIGNSWNVTVVAWLLSSLGSILGLNASLSVQDIVRRTSPGSTTSFQSFLLRPYMTQKRQVSHSGSEKCLVHKLLTLVSIKGEDILLQSASADLVKYHRLRNSVPAKLWAWRTVAGWQWRGDKEHINSLELRAVLTALRWRLERHGVIRSKFVHLVDSLVCLHSLSRGRTSSRRLRRTLLRTNALLLATHSSAVWTYVHTKQNPADAPSRRVRKRKWIHAKKAF
eukprot:Skav224882  [mRNA]  locus=scaffold1112:251630:257035:+ [translate_table: standard]